MHGPVCIAVTKILAGGSCCVAMCSSQIPPARFMFRNFRDNSDAVFDWLGANTSCCRITLVNSSAVVVRGCHVHCLGLGGEASIVAKLWCRGLDKV